MASFPVTVARRYLSSRRHDSFISVTAILAMVSIGLSVCALIVVMGVMNGFRAELLDKLLGYNGHILINGYDRKIEDYDQISDDLRTIDGVRSVVPFIEEQVFLKSYYTQRGGLLRAYPNTMFADNKIKVTEVVDGSIAQADEIGGVILGYDLARKLNVRVGYEITMLSATPVNTAFGTTYRKSTYPVAAIVRLGVSGLDDIFIAMPLGDAQVYFRHDHVNNIEIYVDDPDKVQDYLADISRVVGDSAQEVRTWRVINRGVVEALATERVAMFMVLSLMILVAVFNIASSLFMLVKEKASDIAILRTMGASKAEVTQIFLIIGMVVGLLGILVGSLLAWLIASNLNAIKSGIEWMLGLNLWDPSVRYISQLTVKSDPMDVALTLFLAVVFTFLAAIIPARRAAKIEPVDILRYE